MWLTSLSVLANLVNQQRRKNNRTYMTTIMDTIGKIGLVPVVMIEDISIAEDLADTLYQNDLEIVEITLRTEHGLDAIKKIKSRFVDMLVGAGTVLSVDHAKHAVTNGADFIVAPGFNPELIEWCLSEGIAVIPGCVTPTEIEHALKYDLHILKYFPAKLYGGVEGCKALSEPYRNIKFIPTGGINASNLIDYVDKSFIHAIGGSWMCPKAQIALGNFEDIGTLVRDSINTLLGYRIERYESSTNKMDAEIEDLVGKIIEEIGFQFSDNPSGYSIKRNRSIAANEQSRLLIQTNNIERSRYYLNKKGLNIDKSYSQDGVFMDSYSFSVDGLSESINVVFKEK